ncbi:DUF4145 domain-containing protein [Sinorhizobium medicae]|uniref:DUF4145 domain-containing protein n=1 Tax=Sinorhizobium medicae TaxID=110321 RepID=UPI00396A84AB
MHGRRLKGELFGRNGALSTFEGRIDICYTLGLIDERQAKLLHKVRDIRNKFAHKSASPWAPEPC